MKLHETESELYRILLSIKKLRRANKHAGWFCSMLLSSEQILSATIKTLDMLRKSTK